ncbi:MAG TPA: preprotein translocase subunit SecG [Candidatus Omnitrophota bacterium]|jgi:preprotein translocase subunit SecG|nr:preprotein translocase subunit SecG [Candidatus Omnitrophota bacterium]
MNVVMVLLHVIVCFILILVILLQAGRGQGLTGGAFGAGNVQSILGTKASSFLTKATGVCAVLFLFTCVGLNVMEVQKSRSLYQPKNAQAPLDVDQIRKALDKIKQTEGATQETVSQAATSGQETAVTAASEGTNAVDASAETTTNAVEAVAETATTTEAIKN